MANSTERQNLSRAVPLAGSIPTVVTGATDIGSAAADERITVTVAMRHRSLTDLTRSVEAAGFAFPAEKDYLSPEQFTSTHGLHASDIAAIQTFANDVGLTVDRVNMSAATVVLSGTTQALNDAFGVELRQYEHPEFSYRSHRESVHVPAELADSVIAVLGLDNRPQAKPHFRIWRDGIARASLADTSYTPVQVAQAYQFPQNIDCADQCIGIIELGGGYQTGDLEGYFKRLGVPMPDITAISVDGAVNSPSGGANGPDGEVDLDIEVAACVAPGARLAVYFAPNTDAGFLNAITAAIHDTTNKPSVLSISWGGPESSWTTQAMQAMNQAFQSAAALGITVCCAAGDNGSTDGVNDGKYHVDFPASSPYVLACGGTRLAVQGSSISSETVWNDGASGGATGGGVSDVFALPSWQVHANVPSSANPGGHIGRGVPDVAADADPATGYQVLVDGQYLSIGGTSAVAPLWAGLIAVANQAIGRRVGYLNPVLYNLSNRVQVFHDITSGDNGNQGEGGAYRAGPGWDACTGLGSPIGQQLIAALRQSSTSSRNR